MAITPGVEVGFAAWLKAEGLYLAGRNDDVLAKWGDRALDTAIMSCIANQADAVAEVERQLAFLGGPLVADQHVVRGLRHDLVGRRLKLRSYSAQPLGYDGDGVIVFVLGAVEADVGDTTTLVVLRRLA